MFPFWCYAFHEVGHLEAQLKKCFSISEHCKKVYVKKTKIEENEDR
jgi:hypothetical protein